MMEAVGGEGGSRRPVVAASPLAGPTFTRRDVRPGAGRGQREKNRLGQFITHAINQDAPFAVSYIHTYIHK